MEEKEEVNDILNGNCIANSDVYFCSFYYKAVKQLIDIDSKTNVSHLYRYAKILNKYYDIYCQVEMNLKDRDKTIIKQLKESFYYRILYVYRNATLLSSAIAFYLWNIYEHSPNVIEKIVKKKRVKISSIGGCSIPDIVAIITVLNSIALKIGIELDFRVTIIDCNADWKNTCLKVLSCLEEFQTATWKINFIQCDLKKCKAWTSEVLTSIQEADFITMVYNSCKLKVKWNIIMMICKELGSEAILLLLDRPIMEHVKRYLCIDDLGDFHLIGIELYDYHTLEIEAVKHLRTLYNKHLGTDKLLRSNIGFYLFVSVWVKASSETYIRHEANLECMFQINKGKYNPKQSYLSNNAFTKWKNAFTKKKKSATLSRKELKKIVQAEERKRNTMFGKFIPQKKDVDSLQKHLLTQVQWLEDDRKKFIETNKKSIDVYIMEKKHYSEIKKQAFLTSLTGPNLCSMFQ